MGSRRLKKYPLDTLTLREMKHDLLATTATTATVSSFLVAQGLLSSQNHGE